MALIQRSRHFIAMATSQQSLIEAVRLLSIRLLVGLSVSVVVLIVYSCCGRTLAIRRAKWSYFVHESKYELAAE